MPASPAPIRTEARAKGAVAPGGLALYVHWPFCLSKCPYCDFNSHVGAAADPAQWRAAYAAEIGHAASLTAGRTLTSIFFGGGTPSLMAPHLVEGVLGDARRHWRFASDIEITLEANPTSVESARLAAFRDAGVNRVSLGVQALDDDALRFLGRSHDRHAAEAAVTAAAAIFPRFSFDLIYGRPGQTVGAWLAELDRALAMAGDHLSVYQLTIEKGTPFFAAHRAGNFTLPDDDTAAALFEATGARLADAGLPRYEVSNHARAGFESRHNLAYWRYQDYVGIGPGAHGRLSSGDGIIATEGHPSPDRWLAAVARAGHGWRRGERLEPHDAVAEMMMMGLRLAEGLDLTELRRRFDLGRQPLIAQESLDRLAAGGFVAVSETRLQVTEKGWPVLNAVLAELLANRVSFDGRAGR